MRTIWLVLCVAASGRGDPPTEDAVADLAQADGHVPARWVVTVGAAAILDLGLEEIGVDGPGRTELVTAGTAGPGPGTLAGAGELWRP